MAKKTFIGRAFISITGNKKGLDSVLSAIRGQMESLGKDLQKMGYKLMAAGAAIQAPLTAAVYKLAKFGDEMAKGARRAGISAKTYSEFAHVAELSGTSVARFEKALQAMARGMFDAKRGTGEMKDALKEMGMEWQDLEKYSPEERFLRIADGIAAMKDPSLKAAVAMKVFGKAGAELLPMLNLGAKGIAHYREEARRLGIAVSGEMASNAERIADMLTRVKSAFTGIAITVGNILAPSFDKAMVYLANLVTKVREFVSNNPALVTGLQQIAVALVSIGAGLVGLGTVSRLLAPLVSPGGVLLVLAGILVYITGLLDPLIARWKDTVLQFEIGGRKISDWLQRATEIFNTFTATIGNIVAKLTPVFEKIWGTARASVDYAFAYVKEKAIAFGLWLTKAIGRMLGNILQSLTSHLKTMDDDILGIRSSMTKAALGVARAARVGVAKAQGYFMRSRDSGEGNTAEKREELKARANEAMLAAKWAIPDIKSLFGKGFSDIAGKLRESLAPMLNSIFGQKGAEGGAKSLSDIIKGLGKQWGEWQGAPTIAAGPSLQMATDTIGSFSGRGAAALAREPGQKVQEQQLDMLRQIRDKLPTDYAFGVGNEEFA